MKKFIFHVVLFLLLIGIIIYYVVFRLSNDFDSYKVSKLDGLFTEIIGGLIFLVLLILILKPALKISSHIAENPSMNDSPTHLRFKIVNTSLFKAYDLRIHIFHKRHSTNSGTDITSMLIGSLEGHQVGVSYLQSGIAAVFEESKTNAAQFQLANIVESDQLVRDILNSGNSYLEIHVYLRNGLSGLQGNYIIKFHNLKGIKSGFYKHGFSTEITV